MRTTIGEYSTQMMSYLTLKTVQAYQEEPELFTGSYGTSFQLMGIVRENIDAWIEKVDEKETTEDLENVKADLKSEMKEGGYLMKGSESFLEHVANFLGDGFEDRVFYKLLQEAIREVENE